MAPITASVVGFPPQKLDDERLVRLKAALDAVPEDSPDLLERLAVLLEPWNTWMVEEQVDLHDWIYPLNLMEKAIRDAMVAHSQMLLLPPVERKRGEGGGDVVTKPAVVVTVAQSMEDVQTVPDTVIQNLNTILRFQAILLRNSTSKSLYASVEKMADLLAAADDDLADNALTVLMSLSVPPDLYKQQSPDSTSVNASTALHTSKTQCHARMTAYAVGWGTRAQGLGLEAVVSADDASDPPQEAGFLDFAFYEAGTEQRMRRVYMEPLEFFRDKDEMSVEESTSDESSASKKRRRVMETKSTAEVFFAALEKAGGRSKIPHDRIFSLLADVRLARSFHSQALRLRAVERRLKALIAITHSHPSQEVMTGYFQAQPELCVEIVDLLRPTISSANVSANAATNEIMRHHDAIAGLAQGTSIPLHIQVLAVELLTALVCRRDGSIAALSGTSRMSGVFSELGLGKGQYMGVLPTLVRYSLAALTADPVSESPPSQAMETNDPCIDVGLDFIQATMAPLLPRPQLVLRALGFVEQVLTLTSTVVSNATGASALTEAGLIPSVLSLISIPSDKLVTRLLNSQPCDPSDAIQIGAKVRFVTAQVLQILEASVVTHSHSLSAFHDLQGVEALVSRLVVEMNVPDDQNDKMETEDDVRTNVKLSFSERVLLYGLYTCLTVVFHQEPSSADANAASQAGSVQLRKPALTSAIIKVLKYVESYGGHIAYLVATLLADVMNNDPQIVRHVHTSGIASSFLSLFSRVGRGDLAPPKIPPVGDLISALPNVLAALALTEDGAQAVFEANPFPALLSLYYLPRYAMPLNRCLLNDIASFIGTGLEEVMRHVDKLKPLIIDAVVASLLKVKEISETLSTLELQEWASTLNAELENQRSALIQSILNGGQILEHILHNEDNIIPFVDAGGLDAVLDLFQASLPKGRRFLAHVSALSSPSVGTLHHSTVEDVLFMALRCIAVKYDPVKSLKKLSAIASDYLTSYDKSRKALDDSAGGSSVLKRIPVVPFYEVDDNQQLLSNVSSFFSNAAAVHWISSCLSMTIKTVIRRGEDSHTSFSRRYDREWKKEIASESFRILLLRLAEVHQSAMFQVCRLRATAAYEAREQKRLSAKSDGVKFRLRIVCPEGAIVRDGIEIDSCASVGSMSMGEIADAYDRCVNSNGILRYHTQRGWISEMTRGHGREPISEVVDISRSTDENPCRFRPDSSKRLELAVPDLQTVGCGIMARLQGSYQELTGAISKVTIHSVRNLDTGSATFKEGTPSAIAKSTIRVLADMLKTGFAMAFERDSDVPSYQDAGAAMYLGFMIDSLYSCMFDEKRERRIINLPLLINLTSTSQSKESQTAEELSCCLFDAVRDIFEHCLYCFDRDGQQTPISTQASSPIPQVSRSVASCLPPLVRFLRRLVCSPISVSPLATILSRLKWEQIPSISGDEDIHSSLLQSPNTEFFEPEVFARGLIISISDIVQQFWVDKRLELAPPYLVHPFTGLIGEIMVALEDSGKKKPASRPTQSRGQLLSDFFRGAGRQGRDTEFEATDEGINRLVDMGFSRDHALEALEMTRSNRVEVAMEYALSHPAPSAESAERRRNQRAERLRRREEQRQIASGESNANGTSEGAEGIGETSADGNTENTERMDVSSPSSEAERESGNDVQMRLAKWIEAAASTCVCMLSRHNASANLPSVDGNAEREAMAVVLCSFLFDLCYRYPDHKDSVLMVLLDELGRALSNWNDKSVDDAVVASLCHVVALFTRALPKSRLKVLEHGLVTDLVELVSRYCVPTTHAVWPVFLPPALLLLEAMAQPMVAFAGKDPLKEFTEKYKDKDALPSELAMVFHQHMGQRRSFAELGSAICMACLKVGAIDASQPLDEEKLKLFDVIPTFSSLLPKTSEDRCIEICKNILAAQQDSINTPASIVHGALMLLLQLVRDPLISAACLKDGFAQHILDLPPSCRFTGNTGLVTLILRRLMEDELSLQTSLEIEIRTAVARILSKEKDNLSGHDSGIPLEQFMAAATPLICRDQMSFLRAMSLSVTLHCTPGGQVVVHRSSQAEKLAASKLIADLIPFGKDISVQKIDTPGTPGSRRRSSSATEKGKAPNRPTKRSSLKRSRSISQMVAAPASSIVSLLVHHALISLVDESNRSSNQMEIPFLTTGELLDILADLIIAVPACSGVVHSLKPFKSKDTSLKVLTPEGIKHALVEAVHPPKTFINFLLHNVLGQDRWSLIGDSQLWERNLKNSFEAAVKAKKLAAHKLAKTTQAAARVLAALAIRPGEGRKKVIEDLTFCLSAGMLGHGHTIVSDKVGKFTPPDSSVHALQAWGELCLGLIAPRATGKTLEGSSAIRVENVKIMLDSGMVHALLFALHHVPLSHPMASKVCEALLLPIEVLIRPSVASAVKDFSARCQSPSLVGSGEGRNGGHEHATNRNNSQEVDIEALVNINQERSSDNEEMDVDTASDQNSEIADDASHDNEEESSMEESESSMDEDDEDDDDDEEDQDDDSSGSELNELEINNEVDDSQGWVDGNGDIVVQEDGEDDQLDEDNDDMVLDRGIEDGWTQIESTNFGGMLMAAGGNANPGSRRSLSIHAGGLDERSRGFIDAAEVMIGSLLRTGDISPDALAEIEGTLGVRISQEMAARRGDTQSGLREDASGASALQVGATGIQREAIGTVPHVHQRTQPEMGYSFVSNSSRLFEVSSLEFVFGGPSVTSGSRNYDAITPIQEEEELVPSLTYNDLQLFPAGPGALNTGGTQLALHPLLCGVDLPPSNSIVSDLLPHGVRSRRPGQLTTRGPGEWSNPSMNQGGYLVSTSNGNIIRSSRTNAWAPLGNHVSNREINGPVGWTDDGLPFDASVADLTSALGAALSISASRPSAQDHSAAPGDEIAPEDESPGEDLVSSPQANGSENEEDEAMRDAGSNEEAERTSSSSRNGADGDQVASSLANGLRLSSDNEANADGNDGATAGTDAPDPGSRSNETPQDGANEEIQETALGQIDDDGEEAAVDMDTQEPNSTGGIERHQESGNEDPQEPDADQANRERAPRNANGLVCPPDIDPEVFESLPVDMQQDLVSQHAATQELAAQVEGTSIDPDVLAELPEDVRNEILEQQRRERQAREQNEAPADPSRAEAMDNASFLASVEPELRNEILLTADESFLSTLPASIRAEADVLRERAMAQRRSVIDTDGAARAALGTAETGESRSASDGAIRRRQRIGKIKVDLDRAEIVPVPKFLSPPVAKADLELFAVMLYLLSPIRPQRLMHQLIYNLSTNTQLRVALSGMLVSLLRNDLTMTSAVLDDFRNLYKTSPDDWRSLIDQLFLESDAFPPKSLIGAVPQSEEAGMYHLPTNVSATLQRRKQGIGTAISAAASLPKSSGGPIQGSKIPPIVTRRILDVFLSLCKASPRFCLHMLEKNAESSVTLFDCLLDLLASPTFCKSASNLDHLLTLLESVVSPLSQLPRGKGEEQELAKSEIEAAEAAGKEYADVPRIAVNQSRLKLLCSILRIEACRDTAFNKVNTIIRRLCRVEENRGYVLEELASVAHSLGADAGRDLRSLRIRMEQASARKAAESVHASDETTPGSNAATSVALSTSLSESKLLRVLQTLQLLCAAPGEDHSNRRHEATIIVTEELSHLLRQMQFDLLWAELSACLKVVHVLEGVHSADENPDEGDEENGDDPDRGGRKLRNSSAGLLSRFLPAIEAFLIANASATRTADQGEAAEEEITLDNLVGGKRLIEFVSSNRVLLNALVRNNASLLDKGLRALVQVPRCRQFLEFDVKRSWFKAQMRRLRQHASRRHGSLRLHIRRDRVFQEAYNYLRLRNADEMRGRLHVTFQNEEGIDAGGLSREFFAILAKEMFNPNYALFTATEDGCTFQPNQNSGINPDHMSFFRFVGRIVGKALADGYLLDAHFTRSLYKHMLGMQPTHHDMEAIDPDYYRNLKTILEYNLEDIGLDHLTFSIEERSFGRTQTIDLEPGGRNIPVTEENKKDYVNKICQYRMTTAIQNQIKAYLDGFHELINPELISIFTPRELELMISGLPDIDIDDLKKNTEYTGWRPVDKEIEWFWKVMYELSRDEKAKFLQFVTGSSKVPLAGFSELQGMRGTKKFTINKDSSGGSKGALMSAHTCFNTLDLPVYQSEDELREKLLYAINEGGGAFLFA